MSLRIEPDIGGASIVLVGNFNPPIFHPSWFAGNGLITEREEKSSEVEIVHREISAFRMDWISLRVEQSRFIVETQEAPFIRISDFVYRTFSEFLEHTPVSKLGINRSVHFSVGSEEIRNKIGKILAPHEPWGEWGEDLEGGSPETRGGLRTLTMEKKNLGDRKIGHIRAKIEPSPIPDLAMNGIFMEINDHYEVDNPDTVSGCSEMINILNGCFDESLKRSEMIIDQIMALKYELS